MSLLLRTSTKSLNYLSNLVKEIRGKLEQKQLKQLILFARFSAWEMSGKNSVGEERMLIASEKNWLRLRKVLVKGKLIFNKSRIKTH